MIQIGRVRCATASAIATGGIAHTAVSMLRKLPAQTAGVCTGKTLIPPGKHHLCG